MVKNRWVYVIGDMVLVIFFVLWWILKCVVEYWCVDKFYDVCGL